MSAAARRVLVFALAAAALALGLALVPLRDRCWDPRAATSTRVAVSREAGGCVLHVPSGDVAIDAAECARLRCEPGLGSVLPVWALVLAGGALAGAVAAVWVRRKRRPSSAPAAP